MSYPLTFLSLVPHLPSVVFENTYVEYPLDPFPVLHLKLEFCYSPFYTTADLKKKKSLLRQALTKEKTFPLYNECRLP